MKRALPIVEGSLDPRPPDPIIVRIGDERISIADGRDGNEARRFADLLLEHRGAEVEQEEPTLKVVIRVHGMSREARRQFEALEQSADFVLGSVRPAFARLLAERARR